MSTAILQTVQLTSPDGFHGSGANAIAVVLPAPCSVPPVSTHAPFLISQSRTPSAKSSKSRNVSPATIAMVNSCPPLQPRESVAVMENVKLPSVVGVPLINPSAERLSPGGSSPPQSANVIAP